MGKCGQKVRGGVGSDGPPESAEEGEEVVEEAASANCWRCRLYVFSWVLK